MIPLSYTPIPTSEIHEWISRSGYDNHTAFIRDFDLAIAEFTGAKRAVAVQSGSAALHLGLKLLGVGPGDVVIGPSFTYVATVMPACYLGAELVLIDCDPVSWNLDLNLLESAFIELQATGIRPKVLIVVHNYGMPQPMVEIQELCARFGVAILEDAAEAIGSSVEGRHPGTMGDVGILSFNSNKILTTYGGGALLLNDAALADRTEFLATQAREPGLIYEHREMGYNYRLGALNSVAGLVGLKNLNTALTRRKTSELTYRTLLKELPIRFQEALAPSQQGNFWLTNIVLDASLRIPEINQVLVNSGIEVRRLWNPMENQPYFSNFRRFTRGVGQQLFNSGISLPTGPLDSETLDILLRELKRG